MIFNMSLQINMNCMNTILENIEYQHFSGTVDLKS